MGSGVRAPRLLFNFFRSLQSRINSDIDSIRYRKISYTHSNCLVIMWYNSCGVQFLPHWPDESDSKSLRMKIYVCIGAIRNLHGCQHYCQSRRNKMIIQLRIWNISYNSLTSRTTHCNSSVVSASCAIDNQIITAYTQTDLCKIFVTRSLITASAYIPESSCVKEFI